MQRITRANTYLFDLDDTLYSPNLGILQQVEQRMHRFIAEELSVSLNEASDLANRYYRVYGGTVKGLQKHHNICPDHFMRYSHEVNLSKLQPQQDLAANISALNGKRVIYTNSPKHYATNVLTRLNLQHCFDDIFSLEDADYQIKPHAESYRKICATHRLDTKNTVFFDDQLRNLKPAKDLGMTTVWLSGRQQVSDQSDYQADYESNDLCQFLSRLPAA